MKKITLSLLLLFCSYTVLAQIHIHFDSLTVNDAGFFLNEKSYTGIAFANHKNGRLLREMELFNGEIIKHRNYYAYSTDSIPRIKFETEMKNGKKNGIRRGWYDTGELKFESNYKNNWNNGMSKNWYKNGKPEKEINFKLGVKVGTYKNWDINGVLVKERFYQQTTPTSSKLVKRIKYDKLTGEIISKECFNIEGEVVNCSN